MSTTPTLLPHHARELFEGSGIDPAIAAARGYRSVNYREALAAGFQDYQCGAGLLIPQWTLAGVQVRSKLKRDRPRTDARGKPIKYEAPEGVPPAFDVHPAARHLLDDLATPVYLTEGLKKSDSGCSRGALFVDIGSTWMFLNGRLVVPDLDEIPLKGRLARVVYDSDILDKENVAEALQRLCAALDRRGARVEVVYLPPGPDASKTGVDDFFVGGGTLADLDALSRPWDGQGPGVWLKGHDETAADELRRQRDQARADVSALTQAILNPEVTRQELVAAVSAATQILAKRQRGQVEADGAVILSAAEISGDWRPVPAKGEHIAPTNRDGDRPRLARDRVKPILTAAVERGLVRATPRTIARPHAVGGTSYTDTVWAFDPIPSIAAALSPWGAYRPAEPTVRKPRVTATPCPDCGEAHPIARRDTCSGCGAFRETILAPKGETPAPTPVSDNLSETETPPEESIPTQPLVLRYFIGDDTAEAQRRVTAADQAVDQASRQRATDDLAASLTPIAVDRGRTAVPILAADPEAMDQRRVAAVVSAIAGEGRQVRFDEVASRSGIARVKLINRLDLHGLVLQAKTAGGSRDMAPPPPTGQVAAPPTAEPMTPSLPTASSPLAEAWLRGQGYPPVGPPPVDRWTG